MLAIEYLIALMCFIFLAAAAFISLAGWTKASDRLAIMTAESEGKDEVIKDLEHKLYKYEFFEELKNNDKQDI